MARCGLLEEGGEAHGDGVHAEDADEFVDLEDLFFGGAVLEGVADVDAESGFVEVCGRGVDCDVDEHRCRYE